MNFKKYYLSIEIMTVLKLHTLWNVNSRTCFTIAHYDIHKCRINDMNLNYKISNNQSFFNDLNDKEYRNRIYT